MTFGVWVGVHPDDLKRAFDTWWAPEYAQLRMDGRLANALPAWEVFAARPGGDANEDGFGGESVDQEGDDGRDLVAQERAEVDADEGEDGDVGDDSFPAETERGSR